MNVLSLLDTTVSNTFDTGSFDNAGTASLFSDIDFDSLLAEATEAITDTVEAVDEVVESTTVIVIETLEGLDVDPDVVDVSQVVTDVLNFISMLSEDATISDALSGISDAFSDSLSFFSAEQLESLVTSVNDLISTLAPNLTQLSITPALQQGADVFSELVDGAGIITIDGTSVAGQLTIDGLTREFTADLSDEINGFLEDTSSFLSTITGSASLSGGQFTGDVTVGTTPYEFGLDITAALTDNLTELLETAETTLFFANGEVAVDIPTFLGDIDGTINYAGGDLDLDLTTPLGAVDTSIAFPEDAQFDLPVDFLGISSIELDLFAGQLTVPLLTGGLTIPLEALSGSLALADGLATLSLDNLPTSVETEFAVGPLASEIAVALTEDLSGEIAIEAGEITGSIDSAFGEFDVMASFDDLILQASSFIDQTTGTLTLDAGIASIDLDTPLGPLLGGLSLSAAGTDGVSTPGLLT